MTTTHGTYEAPLTAIETVEAGHTYIATAETTVPCSYGLRMADSPRRYQIIDLATRRRVALLICSDR